MTPAGRAQLLAMRANLRRSERAAQACPPGPQRTRMLAAVARAKQFLRRLASRA